MNNVKEYKIFSEFYEKKKNKENIYYSFCSTGLLFWLNKMLYYIPDDVNLVLICAGLTEEEKEWIHATGRDYLCVDKIIDDTVVWNLLFEINEYSFGWIDIDCFVFDSALFYDCSFFPENKYFINAAWSWKSDWGIKYYNTFFSFISIPVLHKIRERCTVHPNKYVYCGNDLGDENMYVISDEHINLLDGFIPFGNYPRNVLIGNQLPYFDTLVFYETIAQKLGYEGRKIVPLRSDIMQMYFSNQILHVGDSSMFAHIGWKSKFIGENYKRYMETAFVLLDQSVNVLPKVYMNLYLAIEKELVSLGIDKNKAYNDLYSFFVSNGILEKNIKGFFF